jgi:hypothetical protein
VHEPIDEGNDTAGVREHVGPFSERLVGRDDDRFFLVAACDDLEEQIGQA